MASSPDVAIEIPKKAESRRPSLFSLFGKKTPDATEGNESPFHFFSLDKKKAKEPFVPYRYRNLRQESIEEDTEDEGPPQGGEIGDVNEPVTKPYEEPEKLRVARLGPNESPESDCTPQNNNSIELVKSANYTPHNDGSIELVTLTSYTPQIDNSSELVKSAGYTPLIDNSPELVKSGGYHGYPPQSEYSSELVNHNGYFPQSPESPKFTLTTPESEKDILDGYNKDSADDANGNGEKKGEHKVSRKGSQPFIPYRYRDTLVKQDMEAVDQLTANSDTIICRSASSSQLCPPNNEQPAEQSHVKASKPDFERVLDLPSQREFEREWVKYLSTVERYKLCEVKDAILYCIEADQVHKVEFLLDQQRIEMKRSTEKPPEGIFFARYSPNLTAMIQAAKLNRLDIVHLLERRKQSEIHSLSLKKCPLSDTCTDQCDICSLRESYDRVYDMDQSKQLLEIYDALSCPSYLFTQTGIDASSGRADMELVDPIKEAFELSGEMRLMQKTDPSFKKEYRDIEERCNQFATDMLDLCIRKEEADLLLNYCPGKEAQVKHPGIAKINDAIEYEQKEFVAHPYCQIMVRTLWHRGIPDWSKRVMHNNKIIFQLVYGTFWMLGLPLFLGSYFLGIGCLKKLMEYPINKFATKTISLLWFLVFLVVNQALYGKNGKYYTVDEPETFNVVEILIIVWVVDFSFAHLMMFKKKFVKRKCCKFETLLLVFFRKSHKIETLFLVCFWVWISLHIWNINKPNHNVILLGDCFMAVGIILAFSKVIPLLRVNDALAPLQLSLSKMATDVVMIMFIFFITLTGFVIAITTVFNNYEEDNADFKGKTTYNGLPQTYSALFWGIFGHGDIYEGAEKTDKITDDVDVGLPVNITNVSNSRMPPATAKDIESFTTLFVYVLIGIYHVLAVIVLVNTLIAMMASTFNTIQQNSDVEWKFARTKMLIGICKETGPLPVPFILFGAIVDTIHACLSRCRKRFCNSCRCQQEDVYPTYSKEDYKKLLKILQVRYMKKKGI